MVGLGRAVSPCPYTFKASCLSSFLPFSTVFALLVFCLHKEAYLTESLDSSMSYRVPFCYKTRNEYICNVKSLFYDLIYL